MLGRFAAILLEGVALARAQQYRVFWADASHYGFKTPAGRSGPPGDEVVQAHGNAIFIQARRRAGRRLRARV